MPPCLTFSPVRGTALLATYMAIYIAYFFYRCIRVFPYQSIIRSTIAPRAPA